jgi:NADH dehydrogenase
VLADAALKPQAAKQLFELGGPDVLSMNEVVKTALEVQGKKRGLLHQPAIVGKTIGRVASILPSPPLSADAIDFITEPAVADTSTLEAVLAPRLTPFREGLESYLR